ncbi:IS66 family insertion sequence element accessory protein TnpB [Rhizobium sp. K102]|uniref:IS66 family insertion sequence element accessory protein TnpB n=1 Tax=Rhizobium sp. K102 TaxID=2918527 RepID=UPI001EFABA45|nr:IS66 family insertion sequence element accessory protein TnpB [Rhizobium sp. K102]ULR42420.1 IS66 family insertion sequence element accessory protein TnpB [Rhizobium sp. K102]
MIGPSGNVRVYLACGVTDMRRGIDGLSALVETVVREAPGSGAIFGFRGKRADRIKLLWWDGQGFCLFYKILERGYFPWPTAKEGVAHLTQAQLSMLVEGIDWRRPAWNFRSRPNGIKAIFCRGMGSLTLVRQRQIG